MLDDDEVSAKYRYKTCYSNSKIPISCDGKKYWLYLRFENNSVNFTCATPDTHIQELNEKLIDIKHNSFYIIQFKCNVWKNIKHRITLSNGSNCP